MGYREEDNVRKLNVEVRPDGEVLMVLHLNDSTVPALLAFAPGEADALGQRLREAALEGLYMRKRVSNG